MRPSESVRGGAARRLSPAVVIGLDSITGLQTSRILSARGVPVVGVVGSRRHWGARTRVCDQVLESPLQGEGLLATLTALAGRLERPPVLFPCTDPAVATLSRRRDALAGHLLPLAPHETVELLMDKGSFTAHAAAAGLTVPGTALLTSRSDAETAARTMTFPCVLKPPTKSTSWLARTSAKGFTVAGPGELMSLYERVVDWSGELLLQEWVPGPETALISFNGYFDRVGRPLVTFMARKIRQWPPGVGTSASGEECRDDEALDTAIRLFTGVGFHGLAYLEMKRDVRSGRLVLIEANVGRPTGRSAIAERGGVELLHTAYCDAAGLPLPERRVQRYLGARWIDLRRDAQAALVAHRRGELSAAEWLRWLHGSKAHAIWSSRDPLPFLVDILQATSTGGRMLRRRGGPHSSGTPEQAGRGTSDRFSPTSARSAI